MDDDAMDQAVDAAQDTDDGSTYTRRELLTDIRSTYERLTRRGNDEELSRRQFLKLVGVTAATGAVTAAGIDRFADHAGRTPTGNLTVSGTRTITDDRQMGHDQLVVESGAELVIDGDVTLTWDGFSGDRALLDALQIDGTVRFANEGDTLTLDQTANNLGLHTQLGNGAQFGDGRGTIRFTGEVDLLDVDKSGTGPHFMLFPPESGTAEVNRVAWPHGSGARVPSGHSCDGEYGSNIGFSGSFWEYTSDVVMRNCLIWGFSHNLFYWYRHYGSLTLENCLIEHSGSRGVSVPKNGLEMRDVTLNIGGKNAYQLFSCGVGATAFQVETDDGSHREANLQNVHILNRQERCYDGEKARYGFDGGLFGQYYENGGSFTFNLTDCHSEAGSSSPSHVTVNGDWGSNPQCLENPIDNPGTASTTAPNTSPDDGNSDTSPC